MGDVAPLIVAVDVVGETKVIITEISLFFVARSASKRSASIIPHRDIPMLAVTVVDVPTCKAGRDSTKLLVKLLVVTTAGS